MYGVQPDPCIFCALRVMPRNKSKKGVTIFLGILNYLSKYLMATLEMCDLLREETTVKCKWIRNKTYQELWDKMRFLINKDSQMKSYDESEPLYLKTDA